MERKIVIYYNNSYKDLKCYRLMTGKDLGENLDPIEIKRKGVITESSGSGGAIFPFIIHENPGAHNSSDIARAALKAGYNYGETIEYKIVIKPKK